MGAWGHFQVFFSEFGLLAVFVVLFLENFGLPLPGEVALLYAGYHGRVHGGYGWLALVAVGSCACIVGQSIGYGLGAAWSRGMQRLLRISPERRARLESYFHRFGPATILGARFVAGLRVIAGPVAGMAGMRWRPFLIFNIAGAVAWVAAVSEVGALLGAHWQRLLHLAARVDLLVLLLAAAGFVWAWRRLRRGEDKL